ncbi:hypothetical protein MK079_01710 [Candidatus Gracilibacteria bacterium]|nr:hypothetical protein [Candidatus Gracilibacteria bacterium]
MSNTLSGPDYENTGKDIEVSSVLGEYIPASQNSYSQKVAELIEKSIQTGSLEEYNFPLPPSIHVITGPHTQIKNNINVMRQMNFKLGDKMIVSYDSISGHQVVSGYLVRIVKKQGYDSFHLFDENTENFIALAVHAQIIK